MPTNSTSATAKRTSTRGRITVQYAVAKTGLPSPAQLRMWAKAALERPAEVTLRIVGEEEALALNRDYRGKDYATNVLTFAYPELDPLAGDIALCAPIVAREASAQALALEAHYAHLTVHGVLHLQGYDHENEQDAGIMEARESEIVMALGYADPYRREA